MTSYTKAIIFLAVCLSVTDGQGYASWRRRYTPRKDTTTTTTTTTAAPPGRQWGPGWGRGEPGGPGGKDDDGMPQFKKVAFRMGSKRLELNLEKTSRVTYKTPIFEINRLKVNLRDEWSGNKRFAVYQDRSMQASIVMQQRENRYLRGTAESMQYSGVFRDGNDMYELKMEGSEMHLPSGARGTRTKESVATSIDDQDYKITPMSQAEDTVNDERVFVKEGLDKFMNYKKYMLAISKKLSESARIASLTAREDYYVEMLLVLDYSVWKNFMTLAENDEDEASRLLHIYYAHIVNGIDMRYNSIDDPEFRLFVRLSYIMVAKTPGDAPWTEQYKQDGIYTNAYDALDSFEEWLLTMKDTLPPFDQASLYTEYKLSTYTRTDGTKRTIQGLADIMGICMECTGADGKKRYCGASINSDISLYAGQQTGAHEMGHNLGAFHDQNSEYAPSCLGSEQHIMASAPTLLNDDNYKNAYTFSSCSVTQFREHLRFLNTRNWNCLKNQVEHFDRNLFKYLTQQSAGQVLTPDQQCQLTFGANSFYCGGGTRDSRICREMRCWDEETGACITDRQQTELRAADGTTCGNRMWCHNGDCVPGKSAPETPERCIYGEYRGDVLRYPSLNCQQMVQTEPWRCYDDFYNLECCESCEQIKQDKLVGCEYGDHLPPVHCDPAKQRPTNCYDPTTSESCCGTCEALANPGLGKDCEYGDHAGWCSSIYNRQCYLEKHVCCETCQNRDNGPEGCEYGDHVSWCNTLYDRECYREEYGLQNGSCCDSCEIRKFGPPGCEWGDRVPSCHISECTNPSRHVKCCQTCVNYLTTTTSTTTVATTTTKATTTTATTTMIMPVDPKCYDKAPSYCPELPARDCYLIYKDICCETCSEKQTGPPGCEYGDRVGWCKSYLAVEPRMCQPQINLTHECCDTCRDLTPNPPTPSPPSDCYEPDWCKEDNYNFVPGWCYSEKTEKTCCERCPSIKQDKQGCEYGDKYSWCAEKYCDRHLLDCCETCDPDT